MHVPTHILSGWCVASLVPGLNARERFFAMAAATLCDLDGLGMVMGMESKAYLDYHHLLAHNLPFALLASAILTGFCTHRIRAFLLYLALFHLHMVMDYFGSGPDWPIYYTWPFTRHAIINPHGWPLSSWQNTLVASCLLAWTLLVIAFQRRTPLEWPMPDFDRRIVKGFRRLIGAERGAAHS